jgi:hypothetical protein
MCLCFRFRTDRFLRHIKQTIGVNDQVTGEKKAIIRDLFENSKEFKRRKTTVFSSFQQPPRIISFLSSSFFLEQQPKMSATSDMTTAAANLWNKQQIPPNIILAEHVRIRRQANFGNLSIPYFHHGLKLICDDGIEFIIHYTGSPETMQGEVKVDTVDNFIGFNPLGSPIEVVEDHGVPPLELDSVVERAKSRIGERNYNLLNNNCEHFATWCTYGEAVSRQVQAFMQVFMSGASSGGANLQQLLSGLS